MGVGERNLQEAERLTRLAFLSLHPGNERWFDLVWGTAISGFQRNESSTLSARALAASGDLDPKTRAMARDFAILFETLMSKHTCVVEELAARLEVACRKHKVADAAGQRLKNSLNRAIELRKSVPSGRRFHVEWSVGEDTGTDFIELGVPLGAVSQIRFDLVIDERTEDILIPSRKEAPPKLLQIPSSLRAMLWLALTHRGKTVSYEQVATLLAFGDIGPARNRRIEQYRQRINDKLLGDLADKVFQRGKCKGYFIQELEWSCCWVRARASAESSLLLHELPGRPSENQ